MNIKKFVLPGIPALALVFGFVLSGCVTTGGGAPAAPDKAAAQLAAALNAMNEGRAKAEAEGDTVRIAGEVYLKTGLTVPEGVTLDLTADKAKFELQNGAVLTVDGAVEGGLRLGEGTTLINGSGTISLKSKGRLLSVGEKANLTLEGVTLVGIADNDQALVGVNRDGELVLKSGKITGNSTSAAAGGVRVEGTFTMEGGLITSNNSARYGGGVHVSGPDDGSGIVDSAVFIMKGGVISGNSAHTHGGGVNVKGATFIMEGGEISDNSSVSGGGGVEAERGSIFTMKGGLISGNSTSAGGGVRLSSRATIFTMEGGVISGNSAESGAGVRMGEGVTFIMKGGTIYGNDSAAKASGNANELRGGRGAALVCGNTTATWGTGGTYTKGGVPQTGGSDITTTDETLIAIPAP